jgi:hypothetical protein
MGDYSKGEPMTKYKYSVTADKLTQKLANLDAGKLSFLIKDVTTDAEEMVKEVISGQSSIINIRPHSGLHRKGGKGTKEVVTDLVDYGNLLQSFGSRFPSPYLGIVSTNIDYALPVEEGNEYMAGFFYLRGTANFMRKEFANKARKLIREALK